MELIQQWEASEIISKSKEQVYSAIDDGDVPSLFLLGYLYERGSDDMKMDSKFNNLHININGVKSTKLEQNLHLAYKYYKLFSDKCTQEDFDAFKETADANDPEDQVVVGLWYEKGLFVEQNLAEAYKYYKLSKENGLSTGKKLFENLTAPDEFQQFVFGRIPIHKSIVEEGEKLYKEFVERL